MSPVSREPLFRRLTAIMLLVMLAPVTYAGAACAGWSGSAAERMACCLRAEGGCASVSADDCCGSREQRQNLEAVAVVLVIPAATVSQLLPMVLRVPRSFILDPRSLAERPHTYLLDSVFLI